jgi:hypothetical protein
MNVIVSDEVFLMPSSGQFIYMNLSETVTRFPRLTSFHFGHHDLANSLRLQFQKHVSFPKSIVNRYQLMPG